MRITKYILSAVAIVLLLSGSLPVASVPIAQAQSDAWAELESDQLVISVQPGEWYDVYVRQWGLDQSYFVWIVNGVPNFQGVIGGTGSLDHEWVLNSLQAPSIPGIYPVFLEPILPGGFLLQRPVPEYPTMLPYFTLCVGGIQGTCPFILNPVPPPIYTVAPI